ncbi:MAG: hypothetical protein H6937_00915 [Burkholderiales bacterium]|nr:hypothetical protein [Burkholderiales bacterium]MDR4518296.1 hypothetical protein [Nitrosomonas sp.]
MQPTVVMNHHRQTAIIVGKKGKKLEIIKLAKGQLTVTALSAHEIETQGYTVSHYSPSQAARSYLNHGAGVSARAKKCLEHIACAEFSDTLNLT